MLLEMDLSAGSSFKYELFEDAILLKPLNYTKGDSGYIFIRQDAVGGREVNLQDCWKTVGEFSINKGKNEDTILGMNINDKGEFLLIKVL